MHCVADTNIILSGLLWPGTPRRIIDAARNGQIQLFTSPALLAELSAVLNRDKFATPLRKFGSSPDELLAEYLRLTRLVRPDFLPRVSRDPDDDHVLACALAAQATIIISGDADLLALQPA
ncbi:MAG: putative toxin-antitoxin system toxin component, PIN family, partial [Pseudoxanthomonas sp.]